MSTPTTAQEYQSHSNKGAKLINAVREATKAYADDMGQLTAMIQEVCEAGALRHDIRIVVSTLEGVEIDITLSRSDHTKKEQEHSHPGFLYWFGRIFKKGGRS